MSVHPYEAHLGARALVAAGARPWSAFTARWPEWTAGTPAYGSVCVRHDPNAAVAYAAARAGDAAALDAYLAVSQRNWADAGRPPPWTVDDSGFRALAASAGPPAEPPPRSP